MATLDNNLMKAATFVFLTASLYISPSLQHDLAGLRKPHFYTKADI